MSHIVPRKIYNEKKLRITNLQQVRKVTSEVVVNMMTDYNITSHINKLHSKSHRNVYANQHSLILSLLELT